MAIQDRDTGTADLLSEIEKGVLTLTLNRPEARNALSDPMLSALQDELAYAEFDASVRCIVITGAGSSFCAGGDVKAMNAAQNEGASDAQILWQRAVQRNTAGKLFKIPKPTLAVVNGPAAGAGLALALSCDLRLMSSSAILLTAFANVALSGDFGISYFLNRLVGAAKARELMFLPDRISARQALDLGLTNWIADPDDLAEQVQATASRLAQGPSIAVGYMKENLNRAIASGVDECMDIEATHHVHCTMTADHREGAAAFVEKRFPSFSGG